VAPLSGAGLPAVPALNALNKEVPAFSPNRRASLCAFVFVFFRLVSSVSVLVFLTFILFVLREQKMVQRVIEIMANYENRLREMLSVARLSYGRGLVCTDG